MAAAVPMLLGRSGFWVSLPSLVRSFYCARRPMTANWVRSNMLIAAFILVISTAAMVQFAVFSWRSGLLRIASEPIADQADASNEAPRNLLTGKDFKEVLARQDLCPNLETGSAPSLRPVRIYYSALRLLNGLGNLIVSPGAPGIGGWTQREMALCTRYAAVGAIPPRTKQPSAGRRSPLVLTVSLPVPR